ncbi:MAG: xylanase [Opitutae bacterium]|nr:xylanase [Opitutae bacterium]|tara:strand:+ start:1917 stop:2807 length:891 start_codon:yes stop_codon:yes gene_type:complete
MNFHPVQIIWFFLPFSFFGNEDHLNLPLWPSNPPGEIIGLIGPEEVIDPKPGQTKIRRISNVTKPMITHYPADPDKSNGTAVLVCPGGGYNILADEHEGTDVCHWLNDLGITAILLKYRVPRRQDRPKHEAPLQDAQRAMGLIRAHAEKWMIDPGKIGILGFSAGGHLSIMTLTSYHSRSYPRVDNYDDLSCRPDFGILIYPAYLVDRSSRDQLFSEVNISEDTPPCFFAHTGDDHVPAEGSILVYLELEKAGVQGNELHVFPFGGHGYGMRKSENPVSTWPKRAELWMKSMSWIE